MSEDRAAGARSAPGLSPFAGADAAAATLAEKARESGCVNKPMWLAGDTYRCATESGAFSYFNVPGGQRGTRRRPRRRRPRASRASTRKRRRAATACGARCSSDELAAEEKLLAETRVAYADGAPAPLPEERADAEKYRARIARLRQTLTVHEKNIEALKKELAAVK